ncbi:MAG: hypothetical protein Q7J08_00180 [Methanocorpusculum sp.]|uniref:hypothetical protein n=1 Tax=Methanocorpusculum sp. TaxID=2058474 RepID=UPI0027157728|nr:hypothetical protein [Methanocorpusculum sp.]MDO9522123.1 hypothetical protein [Methanocorpusculum sp.]
MRQNRKKQTTSSETIREKHACPKPASKQFQGTGKNRFDPRPEKPTVRPFGPAGTSDPQNRNTKNRIWSQTDYEASPVIDLIINSLEIPKTIQCAAIVNTMHERFAHLILEELKEKALPYRVLDGQTFTIKITFSNERPEEE